jgi:nitrogen fixation/metabolism regulation signal transduction histidine kinase
MRDMVNAFSDYARAPALALVPLDLNQLVREVAWLYRSQDGQPALRLELDEAVQTVEADALRVRQLLHNLLRNAQDALEQTPGGLVEIATRLAVGPGDRPMAEITVTDNGPGIDAETLPRVFDPYVTTKTKGTGLGLAIVKRLVEEHGGTVSATNLPGGGARITVRLPLRTAPRDGQRDNQRETIQGTASHSGTTQQQARPQSTVDNRVAGEAPAQQRRESA